MSQGSGSNSSLAGQSGGEARGNLRSSVHEALRARIESGTVHVGIIGLGYVGLPLARAFSDREIAVLGFDVDPSKVARLERGESCIGHVSDAVIHQMRKNGFKATVDFQRLDEPDVIIICVPTPLTDSRDPDLSYIVNSTRSIAARLRPGQLVVLESTTYPGTTREVLLPLLGVCLFNGSCSIWWFFLLPVGS
jgi:UDP-N-acetyl-D-glucosamine dehydrogenase